MFSLDVNTIKEIDHVKYQVCRNTNPCCENCCFYAEDYTCKIGYKRQLLGACFSRAREDGLEVIFKAIQVTR